MLTKEQMLKMLRADVVPSLGCTEPVCVALAAADASKAVRGAVRAVKVRVNPNIFKNGMSVGIPGFDKVGLLYAAALGALLRNPEKRLELLEDLTTETAAQASALVESKAVHVEIAEEETRLYVQCTVTTENGEGTTVIRDSHTNLVQTSVNGQSIRSSSSGRTPEEDGLVEELKEMTIREIRMLVDLASEEELRFLMDGVEMNERISSAALESGLGVGIARSLQRQMSGGYLSPDLSSRILLKVAAAAEGRLDGCPYPSMSSSGAGTKGLVVILPIAETARSIGASTERTVKALAFGHLVNRYMNAYIGKLAPTCSCSMASATAASAAMTWLFGGDDEQIGFAIRNMTGTITGMICDGGKVGCALKVGMSSVAALTNAMLAADGVALRASDGVCAETPEQCIRNIARIGNPGMLQTDQEILNMMREKAQQKDSL